jgi:hypothetical protein
MPVCPECSLGVPSSFLNCPDCGGDLRVLEIEIELEPLPESVTEVEVIEPELDEAPEPEPEIVVAALEPEPEPEPEPELPVAPVLEAPAEPKAKRTSRKPTERKRRPKTAPDSAPDRRRPPTEPSVVHLALAPEVVAEPESYEVPPDVAELFGEEIGTLREVAGFGSHSRAISVHASAFVVEDDEAIPFDDIEGANLTKVRFDLYRELTITLRDGTFRTLRWLPEYNDDHRTVPILRQALGERLSSFNASVTTDR